MNLSKTPPDKTFQIRCSKLGHQIYFSYCRSENFGKPCFKILDCWYPFFQVDDFLQQELSAEEWHETFERPKKSKIASLVELVEQARKRAEQQESDDI